MFGSAASQVYCPSRFMFLKIQVHFYCCRFLPFSILSICILLSFCHIYYIDHPAKSRTLSCIKLLPNQLNMFLLCWFKKYFHSKGYTTPFLIVIFVSLFTCVLNKKLNHTVRPGDLCGRWIINKYVHFM